MPSSVLMVDHDPKLLMCLGFLLEDAGYDTVMATDADSALAEARRRQPHAMVVELELSAGRTSLCRELREAAGRDTPCLALTAAPREAGLRHQAASLGVDVVLDKPVSGEHLVTQLRRCLEAARP